MITAQELAQWRPFAPWSSDLMVEQDYLLSQCVAAIFEDSFLKSQVAMRGGTVLHKGHLAPASRYSEDIDLVLTGKRPASHIKKALTRVLEPILGQPSDSVITDVRLAVRNLVAKSKIIRTTYTYGPTSTEAALAQLKVEVNINERKSFFDLVPIDIAVPDGQGGLRMVSVQSYDLDEMLGTKLRALLQREHGRDLFDLWWSWETTRNADRPVDPARVGGRIPVLHAARRQHLQRNGGSARARPAHGIQEIHQRHGGWRFRKTRTRVTALTRIRPVGRSAQRNKSGDRRPGDIRGAERLAGLIPPAKCHEFGAVESGSVNALEAVSMHRTFRGSQAIRHARTGVPLLPFEAGHRVRHSRARWPPLPRSSFFLAATRTNTSQCLLG